MFIFINFLNFIINLFFFIAPLCGWSKLPNYSFSTNIWFFVLFLVFTIISFYLFVISILEFIDDVKRHYNYSFDCKQDSIQLGRVTSFSNELMQRQKLFENIINQKNSKINDLSTIINRKDNTIKLVKEQNKYYVRTIKKSKDENLSLKRKVTILEDKIKSMGGNIYEV